VSAVLRRGRISAEYVALERRPGAGEAEPDQTLRHGPVVLDPRRHVCRVEAKELLLTVTEFELFRALLAVPGRAFSRLQLVQQAYGAGHYISDRTVDSHIRRLRQKLGAHADWVETVYGVGYRLRE
jgi:DNA-binding response OmpR family regulator